MPNFVHCSAVFSSPFFFVPFSNQCTHSRVRSWLPKLSLTSAFKAVTLNQWYSYSNIIYYICSYFFYLHVICSTEFYHCTLLAKRNIAGVVHLIPLEDNVFVFAIWCSMHSRRFIFIVFCELHILHYKEEFGSHLTTGSASRSAWVEEAQLGHRSDLFFVQYDDCVWHWASISVEIVGLSFRQWSLWGQYTAQAWGNKATQARIRIYIL